MGGYKKSYADLPPVSHARTPPTGSDLKNATDAQIYREYEICMNYAMETVKDDKLKGQEMVVNCFAQLQKYGERTEKRLNPGNARNK